jgi:hypothetical protein
MDKLVTGQMANQLKKLGMKFELPISYDGEKVYHHHLEPTIHQVRDWFLNENGIFIRVDVSTGNDDNNGNFGFFFDICKRGEYKWEIIGFGDDWYDTHDEALFAGIVYALGNIDVLGNKVHIGKTVQAGDKLNGIRGVIVDVKYEDDGFGNKDYVFYVKDNKTERIKKFSKCDLQEEVVNIVYKSLS